MSEKESSNGRKGSARNEADESVIRFISMKEVSRRVGYTPQHIRRLIAAGEFPSFVHLGKNKIGFVEAEVTAWQRERIARRNAKRDDGEAGVPALPSGPRPALDSGASSAAKSSAA